jgi:hypothetical protein
MKITLLKSGGSTGAISVVLALWSSQAIADCTKTNTVSTETIRATAGSVCSFTVGGRR